MPTLSPAWVTPEIAPSARNSGRRETSRSTTGLWIRHCRLGKYRPKRLIFGGNLILLKPPQTAGKAPEKIVQSRWNRTQFPELKIAWGSGLAHIPPARANPRGVFDGSAQLFGRA